MQIIYMYHFSLLFLPLVSFSVILIYMYISKRLLHLSVAELLVSHELNYTLTLPFLDESVPVLVGRAWGGSGDTLVCFHLQASRVGTEPYPYEDILIQGHFPRGTVLGQGFHVFLRIELFHGNVELAVSLFEKADVLFDG